MTQEEKARAYDDALTTAKRIISKNCSEVEKLCLKCIFPTLSESDDERVRMWLLDYAIGMIACLESDISFSTYDGIKGHDPEAETELAQWQKARAYLEKQKEQKPNFDTHWENGSMVCEQKEQKPAEWSEEDEKMLEGIICILQKYVTRTLPTRPNSCTYSGNAFYTHQTEIDWLKSLRPSWKPSEEQMKALKNSAYGTYQNGDGPVLRGLYEQLLKLGVK